LEKVKMSHPGEAYLEKCRKKLLSAIEQINGKKKDSPSA
jgi:hypothetical protein